jgi:hypothetical protein
MLEVIEYQIPLNVQNINNLYLYYADHNNYKCHYFCAEQEKIYRVPEIFNF